MPVGRRVKDKTSLDDLERTLGAVVRRITLPRLHEHIASMGGIRLERAAYGVLVRLADNEPIRVTDLACALGVDLSTTSRQIAQLEAAGLVAREPDPDDGRASRVSLTDQGKQTLSAVRKAWRSVIREIVSDWPPEERSDLARLLAKLGDALAAYTEQTPRHKAAAR